jgi:hypothetical protein
MAMTEKYQSQLRELVLADMSAIRDAGVKPDSLGMLLFKIANGDFSFILACGESMYNEFAGIDTKGQALIASLRRFVMSTCSAIFHRKTRDCGFFKHGIRYCDKQEAVVTWEELLSEFSWGKNPEFAYRIERIHRP